MARRRKGRPVHGVLLIDKPKDLSSNDVVQRVKRIYFAQKAGHTGALDPLATGMLPVCLGEATKFSQFLLDADKRYRVLATLGVRTTTSDAYGEVVSERPVAVSQQQLEQALETFRGPQKQVPSMFSALKYQGQPLYKYAREGIEVPREARDIEIFELTLLRFEGGEVELDVHCSKGTYIRSLVDDLGEKLGCGAHVSVLRRTAVAGYPADAMITLEQLNQILEQTKADDVAPGDRLDPLLLPMDTAASALPEVNLLPEVAGYFLHGQSVQASDLPMSGLVRVTVGEDRCFVGVGEIDDDLKLAPKRLIQQAFLQGEASSE